MADDVMTNNVMPDDVMIDDVIKILKSQLNSASAGHAKIPVRLAVKYLQQAMPTSIDKFGDDACFILNSKRKGMI